MTENLCFHALFCQSSSDENRKFSPMGGYLPPTGGCSPPSPPLAPPLVPPTSSIFKKESNRHCILFTLHKEIIKHSYSFWFPGERTPIVILHIAPPNRSNVRIRRRPIIKQHSNSNPITKIFFQIIFEFTWFTTPAFTVTTYHSFIDIKFTKRAI